MRLLEYEDLRKIEYVSDPHLSPEGTEALYVVNVNDETGGFVPSIWRVILSDLKTAAEFLPVRGRLSSPSYSPDGKYIAFLSDVSGEKQIWLWERDAENARQLTTLRHGIGSYVWSPDGGQIAFTASLWKEEEEDGCCFKEMTQGERCEFEHHRRYDPVEIETLMYKMDEAYGLLDGSVSHIGVVRVQDGEARLVTKGPVSYEHPAWSPDSLKLCYGGKPHAHVEEIKDELYVYDFASGEQMLEKVENFSASDHLMFTADGQGVIYSTWYRTQEGSMELAPFLHRFGEKQDVNLMEKQERTAGLAPMVVGHTAYGSYLPELQMDPLSGELYFLSGWQGTREIYRLSTDGRVEQVTCGHHCIHGFCAPRNGKLLYVKGDACHLAQVYVFHLKSGQETCISAHNAWLADIRLSVPQERWVDSQDGAARIHGYVMKPTDYEEGRKYPAVLDIHGGPDCYYAYDFWFEFQMLAARGLAVVYCDPRGSAGYGPAFHANGVCWGQEPIEDLHAFVDAAAEEGFIDKERVGCTGGSYGGHMTNRLIGSYSSRYKAAVTQRTLVNTGTSYGTGDMGFFYRGKDTVPSLKGFLDRVSGTPITRVDQMKTPHLILHGEKDYRCTREQAEQLFIAMKERNPEVPVKMVIFPEENHGLTRGGKVHFQIKHLYEMCEWFCKYLKSPEEGGEVSN